MKRRAITIKGNRVGDWVAKRVSDRSPPHPLSTSCSDNMALAFKRAVTEAEKAVEEANKYIQVRLLS